MVFSFFLAVVLRSRLFVVSISGFFVGNTSERSLSSLQNGLRKSLKLKDDLPTENTASYSSFTYSSQSCRNTLTSLVASISLKRTGSWRPTRNTCLCMNLQADYCGISLVLNFCPSTNSTSANIGLYFGSVWNGISLQETSKICSGLSFLWR